jgi:serine/threonine-protein kinase
MSWQVGDYAAEDEKPFDQGSFGTVWRARRISDGQRVALKLVLLTDADDGGKKIAAERHGAMLQQKFEHAHGMVPKVYDYGQDGKDFFIAMELVEGGALADLIKKGPLPPQLAARHAATICEFLDKAHRFATTIEGETYERVVHADLKPGHVLIAGTGEMKVLDFGIAKALAKATLVTTNEWGTYEYASPERLEFGRVNEHVDFWSLGVILYEMVSGHRPYPRLERNRSQLEHAIRTNAPREPLPPSCPSDLAAIINKLLAYQVERRYPTAAAISSDLTLFVNDGRPLATNEYATPPTMPIRPATSARPPQLEVVAVPPTDPLPIAAPAARAGIVDVIPPPAALPAPVSARHVTRKMAWVAVLLSLVWLIATEGVAWMAAERFRGGIETLDGHTLSEKRQEYDGIRGWSFLDAGLRARVNRPLKQRLVSIADTVIADYRREEPTMGVAEWRQAFDALRWASALSPRDGSLRTKQLISEAHLTRFAARGQPPGAARLTYRKAVEKFRAAADLDTQSFDPYLGISRIQVYGLGDVDEAAAAINEAEKRGYVSGRRERAQLGDGYLRRANARRNLAHTLSGDQRRRELENARGDYARCIETFDPIVGFGRAAANLEICKRQLERVTLELDPDDEKL